MKVEKEHIAIAAAVVIVGAVVLQAKKVSGVVRCRSDASSFPNLNQQHMNLSIGAGRNVIPIDKLDTFLDPHIPISDHFTKVRKLGSGAFGSVSLYTDPTGNQFAIKTLARESEAMREFANGLKLDHPNIVRIHNMVSKVDGHHIVMEYVKGQPMSVQGLSQEQRLHLLREVLDGYEHALSRGLVPNDLWYNNLLITDDGHWKYVDLGLYVGTDGRTKGAYMQYFEQLNQLVRHLGVDHENTSLVTLKLEILGLLERTSFHYRQQWHSRISVERLQSYIARVRRTIAPSYASSTSLLFHSRS